MNGTNAFWSEESFQLQGTNLFLQEPGTFFSFPPIETFVLIIVRLIRSNFFLLHTGRKRTHDTSSLGRFGRLPCDQKSRHRRRSRPSSTTTSTVAPRALTIGVVSRSDVALKDTGRRRDKLDKHTARGRKAQSNADNLMGNK